MLVGAEHLKVLLLGTAGFCPHGRWQPGAGLWHPGKGEDEEVTPLPVYSLQPGASATKKTPKTQRMRCRQFPEQPKKPAPPWQQGGTGPQTASRSSSAPWEKWGGGQENGGGILG